jgi:hypothetical protein
MRSRIRTRAGLEDVRRSFASFLIDRGVPRYAVRGCSMSDSGDFSKAYSWAGG